VKDIHAMLLIADDDHSNLGQKVRMFLRDVLEVEQGENLAEFVAVEHAIQRRDRYDLPIEHFGFRDGISNPMFIKQDIEKIMSYGGASKWDPRAPLDLVLVPDRYGKNGDRSLGSYLVYRKYEQHVAKFESIVSNLGKEIGEENLERARALIVGRFRDGTPITVRSEPYGQGYLNQNYMNFNFEDDPEGSKCPLHAHTRKVNPRYRDDKDKGTDHAVWKPKLEDETSEKLARIVRRGMTYGKRKSDDDQGRNYGDDQTDLPDAGVGLLFMSFQRNIEKQFEYILKEFVNKRSFPEGETGSDSIIGQEPGVTCQICKGKGIYEGRICTKCGGDGKVNGSLGTPKKWPLGWGKDGFSFSNAMSSCVTLKGGEYFFAPSISFLKALFESTLTQPEIKRVQEKLGVKVTGQFDPSTRKALEKFESENGIIPSDGYLSRENYDALMKS
jgi:Dyp-type peroxidase family